MPEKIQFYPVDITYKVIDGRPVIFIYGTNIKGEQICITDPGFEPYFYVIPKKGVNVEEKLKKIEVELENNNTARVTKTESVPKKLNGVEKTAIKVFTQLPRDVPLIKDVIKNWEIIESIHEYDILFVRRYLIDKQIIPMTLTEAEVEPSNIRARVPVFTASSITQVSDETRLKPRVLGIDIETYNPEGSIIDSEKNPIIMVALYSENFQKILTWKKFKTSNRNIEFVDGEAELLQKMAEAIKEFQPEIITGYYSDGFDLPYISVRTKKYKINLELGLDSSEPRISQRGEKKAYIEGIAHVDVIKFIRKIFAQELELESYKLDDVAGELLNEKKHEVDIENLADVWDKGDEELDKYCSYNLHDAKLAYLLFFKIFPNLIEMVKIVGLPLFDINRMAYSQLVEWYILRQTKNFNELAPIKPGHDEIRKRRLETYTGAFVYQPDPGLYKDIMVFDFKSLYPSIISSHNIGPSTFHCSCCVGKASVPTGDEKQKYWFCLKRKGFIPTIIEEIITRRIRIKEVILEKKENLLLDARQNSLKILANAFYGYLGFAPARWYCIECARSITAYARDYIKKAIKRVNDEGFKVIYSDTDSVFFTLSGKTKEDSLKLLEKINLDLHGLMELELEGFYLRGLFVSMKEGSAGAKKKYALINEKNVLKVKGFETVRRNCSPIAKKAQINVLKILLEEENPEKAYKYIRKIIQDLKENKINKKNLIITTQLTKDIESYDNIGPHVAIAQRMRARNIPVGPGTIIKYIICRGSGKLRDRARLPNETSDSDYDSDYYINNQVIPSVDKIFQVFGYKKEDLVESKQQSKLGSYFK